MHNITRTALAVVLTVGGMAALTACSESAPGATNFDTATGKHTPVDWSSNHGSTYVQYQKQCQECHGADLAGGSSKVSCFTAVCHAFGPHQMPFRQVSSHTKNVATSECAVCHGAAFAGGKVAPSCNTCHVRLAPGAPPLRDTCVSCHTAGATGPDGSSFPNRSGAHPRHFTRTANISCGICHYNAGTGTPNHGSSLTVRFPAAINVPGKIAAYDQQNRRCSNVSCHGGITTIRWGIDRLQTDTSGCTTCHRSGAGDASAPFNSYSSGEHTRHVGFGLKCIDCHDVRVMYPATPPSHFSNLTTGRLELVPRFTLRTSLQYQGNFNTCTPGSPSRYSFNQCHPGKDWR